MKLVLETLLRRKAALENRRVTQRELARCIGITPPEVTRLINHSRRTLSFDQLKALAEFFNVSIPELFDAAPSLTESSTPIILLPEVENGSVTEESNPPSIALPHIFQIPEGCLALFITNKKFKSEGINPGDVIIINPNQPVMDESLLLINLNRKRTLARAYFTQPHFTLIEPLSEGRRFVVHPEEKLDIRGVVIAILHHLN